jgi:hypothetical protein
MAHNRGEYDAKSDVFTDIRRTADFWRRTTTIYGAYKLAQLRGVAGSPCCSPVAHGRSTAAATELPSCFLPGAPRRRATAAGWQG